MFLITQSLGQSLIPHYACDMAYTKAIKMPVFWTDSCVIIMVFNDYNCLYVPCSSGCSIYHAIKFYFDSIYVLNIKCFQTNTIVRLMVSKINTAKYYKILHKYLIIYLLQRKSNGIYMHAEAHNRFSIGFPRYIN